MVDPMTLDEFIAKLIELRDSNPDYASRPVHILDMEDELSASPPVRGGLVTHVETDCFTDEQGPVTSVLSWPGEQEFIAAGSVAAGG